MEYLKKIGKSLLYVFVPILVIVFILTLLNYFGIMSYKTLNVIKYVVLIISVFVGAFIFGKNSKNKGWLEGLKFGGIILLILLLFNYLVFTMPFNIKALIYYCIVLGMSIAGSVLGINRKSKLI